jgi:hypothetical protein
VDSYSKCRARNGLKSHRRHRKKNNMEKIKKEDFRKIITEQQIKIIKAGREFFPYAKQIYEFDFFQFDEVENVDHHNNNTNWSVNVFLKKDVNLVKTANILIDEFLWETEIDPQMLKSYLFTNGTIEFDYEIDPFVIELNFIATDMTQCKPVYAEAKWRKIIGYECK